MPDGSYCPNCGRWHLQTVVTCSEPVMAQPLYTATPVCPHNAAWKDQLREAARDLINRMVYAGYSGARVEDDLWIDSDFERILREGE